MSMQITGTVPPSRRFGRSAGAILLGFLTVVVPSIATDHALHVLQVYPPYGFPMYDTGLLLLALGYRSVYAVLGSYVAASLAPSRPMHHALGLGVIGFVLSTAGALGTQGLGPIWYPVALVLTTLPCAWLGGLLHRARHIRH